jgi:phospholipid transport system substrate-binding protein
MMKTRGKLSSRPILGLTPYFAGWIVVSLVCVSRLPLAIAGTPTDQVRGTVDRVLAILQDPTLKSADKHDERREQLTKVIAARFDFDEMARRSLGAEWRRLTASQRQQFVELFTGLLRDAYVGNFETYKGETVVYTGETQEAQYAVVQTLLRSPDGTEYSIDYRLHLIENQWKAYDVVIENVSVVNNYRSQFARVIHRSSFDGLMRALRDKVSKDG